MAGLRQMVAGDHHLLHLRGAFVDAQRPDLAIEALDRHAAGDAEPAEDLHRLVDHLLGAVGGVELGERRLAAVALPLDVAQPGGAVDEQGRGIDVEHHLGEHRLDDRIVGERARRRACGSSARVVASSSARRAKPSAAAPTVVRKTSSVAIACAKPRPRSPSRAAAGRRMSVEAQRRERMRRDHLDPLAVVEARRAGDRR